MNGYSLEKLRTEAIINFDKVPVYQKEVLVLNDVTFKISKGEFVFLIGKTGSGKSSLLKTFYGDIPVTDGYANVVGYDLMKLKNNEIPYLRRRLGIIFQDFQLLNDRTVVDNLIFVMKATGWKDNRKIKERLQGVLKKIGLETKGHKMTHQLSQGEQQRIAIGRAIINNPDIILADEPTGNLDPETSKEIVKLLFNICFSGRAVVMATHDYSLFQDYKARTLKCEDGMLKELENQFD